MKSVPAWPVLLLLLHPVSASAGFPTPESHRIPFTMEQVAALTVARSDFILEATVVSVQPLKIGEPVGCRWIAEIWLRPTRQIWGEVADQTFKVVTEYLPEEMLPLPDCGAMRIPPDEDPPPQVADRGLFLLTNQWRLVDGVPTLSSTRCGFLPRTPDGMVTPCLLQLPYPWLYDDFVAALIRHADELSITRSSEQAEVIVIGRMGAVTAKQLEEVDGVLWASWPVTVMKALRGEAKRASQLSLPVMSRPQTPESFVRDQLGGNLVPWMNNVWERDVVIFARRKGTRLVPVGIGMLAMSEGRRVHQRPPRIQDGKLDHPSIPLTDLMSIVRATGHR